MTAITDVFFFCPYPNFKPTFAGITFLGRSSYRGAAGQFLSSILKLGAIIRPPLPFSSLSTAASFFFLPDFSPSNELMVLSLNLRNKVLTRDC